MKLDLCEGILISLSYSEEDCNRCLENGDCFYCFFWEREKQRCLLLDLATKPISVADRRKWEKWKAWATQ
jgi:hypothetical protein